MRNVQRTWNLLIKTTTFWLFTTATISSLAGPPSALYRMDQLEEVKKLATTEHKPIAWIGLFARNLTAWNNLKGKGSHAATAYAIRALQNDAVLIYSDETQNHHEPPIIDHELHTPNPEYVSPTVVILTPAMDKVITKILYIEDGNERIQAYTEALKKIRDKKSWETNP
jgi:hypothetical protein